MLDANEALLQATLENAPLGFWVRDREGNLIVQNPASRREWGKSGPRLAEGNFRETRTLAFWAGIKGGVVEQEIAAGQGRKRRFYHTIIAPYVVQGDLRGVLGFNINITERKRAEMRNSLIAETASHLLRAVRPQDAIGLFCGKIARFLECELFASAALSELGELRINASIGIPPELMEPFQAEEARRAGCADPARPGCRVYLNKLQTDPAPENVILCRAGLQGYVCHPLVAAGRVLGTLSFGSRTRPAFMEEELSMMQTVADFVAIAIQRQRANAELRRVNAELEKRVEERTRALQEATDQLNAFCHTVAHDLRAPLRAQQDFSELLLREHAPDLGPSGQDFARRISEPPAAKAIYCGISWPTLS